MKLSDIEIVNKCGAIFDHDILIRALDTKIFELYGKAPSLKYTISLREGYPSLCIGHEHYRLHSLLGWYFFGVKHDAIHHIDGNKLNNLKQNLLPLTHSEHIKLHNIIQFVSEEHKKDFGRRVARVIRRNDVTEEDIKNLREQGLTVEQISKKLKCGTNTVYRRLKMISKAIDWSEVEK